MAELAVRNWSNETVRTIEVDDRVFDYPLKEHLIYEAVVAYRAGGRSGTHSTKNRKEVSGGTRKLCLARWWPCSHRVSRKRPKPKRPGGPKGPL